MRRQFLKRIGAPASVVFLFLGWLLFSPTTECAGVECGAAKPILDVCTTPTAEEFSPTKQPDLTMSVDTLETLEGKFKEPALVEHSYAFATGGCAGAPGGC